jgi:hypothetical protein
MVMMLVWGSRNNPCSTAVHPSMKSSVDVTSHSTGP